MTVVAKLIGGPLDGKKLKLRAKLTVLWIDVRSPHKCYRAPGRHRVLYMHEAKGRWLMAHHTHAQCTGCGCYVERMYGHVANCSLCGGALMAH